MRGVCEECLRPIEADRCGEHPFARPLLPDDPDDQELLRTLRGLRADRRNQLLLFASIPGVIAVMTASAVVLGGLGVLHGFVASLLLLLGGGLALLPVLPVLWIVGLLGQDAVTMVRRRLGWLRPSAEGMLPELPVQDPIRAAEQARAVRTAHRAARAPRSTGPRFLH